jgi:hypothetical protein
MPAKDALRRNTTRRVGRKVVAPPKARQQAAQPHPDAPPHPAHQPAGDHAHDRPQKPLREIPDTYHRPADLDAAKRRAIRAMREHGVLAEASRAGPIGRRVMYQLMKEDPAFRQQIRDAKSECLDDLERAMIARGKYSKGDLAGIFVMKHNRPRYADGPTRIELTGKDGGPVLHADAKEELGRRLDKLAAALQGDALDVVGQRKGPALVSEGDGVDGVVRVAGSTGSAKPRRGVRVG